MKDFAFTANKDEYYRDHTICVDMVELHLKSPTGADNYLAFNTGGFDFEYTTPTKPAAAASNVFQGRGDFLGFSSLTEDFDVKVGKFSIYLSGIGGNLVQYLMANEVEGKRVVVYKAFFGFGNTGTSPLSLVADPIRMFDGIIYNYVVQESSNSCSVTIDCSSLFADFERLAGRKSNNWSNWLYQGDKSDAAFEKAGWVGQTEFLWGRSA